MYYVVQNIVTVTSSSPDNPVVWQNFKLCFSATSNRRKTLKGGNPRGFGDKLPSPNILKIIGSPSRAPALFNVDRKHVSEIMGVEGRMRVKNRINAKVISYPKNKG